MQTLVLAFAVVGAAYVTLVDSSLLDSLEFAHVLGIMVAAAAVLIAATYRNQRTEVRREAPPKKPFVPRAFTEAEIAWYDGNRNAAAAAKKARAAALKAAKAKGDTEATEDTVHPLKDYDDLIFVGVKGKIYNVGHDFYGPGSAYNAFAGCDASRHLGKVVVGKEESNADWSVNFTAKHLQTLDEWEAKFQSKYNVVGWITFGENFTERAKQFDA